MPIQKKYKKAYSRYKKQNIKSLIRKTINSNVETKELSLAHNTIASLDSIPSTGGASYLLSNIVVGATRATRIGNQIDFRGIRFYLPIQNAISDTINHIRIMMVTAKRSFPNTTTNGLFSDVFGTASWNMHLPINVDKYTVLYDKFLSLRASSYSGTTSAVVPETRLIKGYVKVNKRVNYEFDTIIGSDRPTTDVLLLAVSDSSAIPNPGALGGYVKLYYKDA